MDRMLHLSLILVKYRIILMRTKIPYLVQELCMIRKVFDYKKYPESGYILLQEMMK